MSDMHYVLYNEDTNFNSFYQWIKDQTCVGMLCHKIDINSIVHYSGFIELIHIYCSPGGNSTFQTQQFLQRNMEYILNNKVRIVFHNSAATDLIDYLLTRKKFDKKYLKLPKVFKLENTKSAISNLYYAATFMVVPVGDHKDYYIKFSNGVLAYYQKSSYYSFVFFDVVGTTVKDMPLPLAYIISLIRDDEPEIGSNKNNTGDELSPV